MKPVKLLWTVSSNDVAICSGLAAICNASILVRCRKFTLYRKLCK